jgi:hypothetical protein
MDVCAATRRPWHVDGRQAADQVCTLCLGRLKKVRRTLGIELCNYFRGEIVQVTAPLGQEIARDAIDRGLGVWSCTMPRLRFDGSVQVMSLTTPYFRGDVIRRKSMGSSSASTTPPS